MPLKVTVSTTATREPLELEELKPHLRLELGYAEEDDVLRSMIGAAREYAESYTRRKFIKQTVKFYTNSWPFADFIKLPYTPFSTAVAPSVTYKNYDSSSITLATSAYVSDSVSEPGRIHLDSGQSWPSVTLHDVNPITITYVVGYSSVAAGVPIPIRSALKLIVGDLYENREGSISNHYVTEVNMGIKALLNPYRVFDGI